MPRYKPEEARVILEEVNTQGMPIPLEDFASGLEVELEHGTRFQDANVTNNHPILTGRIVLATSRRPWTITSGWTWPRWRATCSKL